ncbi:hypothetical protein B0H21DRAFT_713016 [Amylocystis lapponica]|nr:hypothetical protein B0H21DRAFT_713016 [Amylocystis lapponica]
MSDADTDAIIVEAYHLYVNSNYCIVAVMALLTSSRALLLYDHALTFPGEIKLIWTRRWSGVTMLFMINRYFALLNKAFLVVDSFPWPNQTNQAYASSFAVSCCQRKRLIYRPVFSVLRVYAIWDKDWRPCVPVLAIGLVVPGINLYQYSISTPQSAPPPLFGCGEDIPLSDAAFTSWSLATHSFAIVEDALVLVLTWIKTYGIKRIASQMHVKATLTTMLLRDGTVYFATLLILNVVSLIVLKSSVEINPVPNFIDAFTCILISRFILNLREAFSINADDTFRTQFSSQLSVPQFASRFLGNLGAPLEHGTTFVSENTGTTTAWDSVAFAELSKDPLAAGLFPDNAEVVAFQMSSPSTMEAVPPEIEEMEFAAPSQDVTRPTSQDA